ncbi:hydrogenase-2 component protein [Pectobacterium atrosepticum SCRI1043]|uniref:Hydrogenase-2 component protein n=1 Tax=Pectobacterium atrosepticum (strain SCRI 1043 / ATCC BAA-672) TaxID=218491 RepID=Q6D7U5_PECAS|nr:hydrogenase-2 assembly chaperone [Pectobacterium atrosepticum]GKV86408.1 hydrogenase [Pectobacterium carotovorum subsp. carotovorum]AIK13107.1 hydrogenase-2 component protein [Pectobacterium atrosepticum]KFX16932.1 hydrogenase [Pectobacterium atrosepticum]KMK80748.1 hydrogenase 2-specific chaperone [Pectobacterium atrosepticum ICMP 1526]MCL6317311.1 hydrogenase-2 assembly chaperone [Pectobacterium atrosepticum]
MPDFVNGFQHNPAAQLETAFQAIAEREMQSLPFFQPQIPVSACGFQLFEHQWIGCMLTPWMLSLLVLPGPDQCWLRRTVGESLGLSLPCGDIRFTVGYVDGCGQYLASSLMSPLNKTLTAESMLSLAEQTVRMALSLPVVDGNMPASRGRRAFFHLS